MTSYLLGKKNVSDIDITEEFYVCFSLYLIINEQTKAALKKEILTIW